MIEIDPIFQWVVGIVGGGLIIKILYDWLANSSLKEKVAIIDRENRGEHAGIRRELKEFKKDVKEDIGRVEESVGKINDTVTNIYRDMPKRIADGG